MKTDINSAKMLESIVLEHTSISGSGEDEIRRAEKTDEAIAGIANTRGIPTSPDKIRRIRIAIGVFASSKGGTRQGAGRPRGSENKHSSSQPKVQHKHNLSIGTASLVDACRSAYKVTYEKDSFDYCKNEYAGHREVWKYIGGATRPYDLPGRYSPSPMAIMGRSSNTWDDAQKFQAIKGK